MRVIENNTLPGALRESAGALRQSLILARELESMFDEGISLQQLGRLLIAMGDSVLSLIALKRSQAIYAKQNYIQIEGVTGAYFAERSLWLRDFAKANAMSGRALALADVRRHERDFIHAALLHGRAALGMSDLVRADERLYHALTRSRAFNVVELEIPALIAIAELEIKHGNFPNAKARLSEVWEAAERGPYPLHRADAYNILADIERAKYSRNAAIEAATKAYQGAWCGASPYAYH